MLQYLASQIIQAGLRNYANRDIKLIGKTYFIYVVTLQWKKNPRKVDVMKTSYLNTFQIVQVILAICHLSFKDGMQTT